MPQSFFEPDLQGTVWHHHFRVSPFAPMPGGISSDSGNGNSLGGNSPQMRFFIHPLHVTGDPAADRIAAWRPAKKRTQRIFKQQNLKFSGRHNVLDLEKYYATLIQKGKIIFFTYKQQD